MPVFQYLDPEKGSVEIDAAEKSVLDALLDAGIEVANSCRSGICHSCLLECREGELPAKSQSGLKTSHQTLNYFKACQCEAADGLVIAPIDSVKLRYNAEVISVDHLSGQILRLVLASEMSARGGQFINVWREPDLVRSYSLASASASPNLELHIRRYPDGQFSAWASQELKVGDTLEIQGPMGACFYQGNPEKRMLLAGIGTGLAPLLGIVRDALATAHQSEIHLYHGVKTSEQFYLLETLQELALAHPQLHLHLISQEGELDEGFAMQGDIYSQVATEQPELKGWDVYLCGAESFVRKMRRQCFLAGAGMGDIYADAFLPAQVQSA